MKNFIVYNAQGKILRIGCCQDRDFDFQAHDSESITEGIANSETQKIVEGEVVDKSPQEIAKETYTPVIVQLPFEQQQAHITNEQWQDVLDRLSKLET